MASKQGGSNRKFGRHGRNPSSQNQAKRTERNKARRAQRIVHTPPKYGQHALTGVAASGKTLWQTTTFRGKRERVYCA